TAPISTFMPPERYMRRLNSPSLDSTSWAACLPASARFSSASSTGNSDCASSRVKVFIGVLSIGYENSANREQERPGRPLLAYLKRQNPAKRRSTTEPIPTHHPTPVR